MKELEGRLKREHETLVCMTGIYCSHHHRGHPGVAKCPVHCYKPAQREAARKIMRFAGPHMVWRHPLHSLFHLFDKFRKVEHPMELRRRAKESRPGK